MDFLLMGDGLPIPTGLAPIVVARRAGVLKSF